MDPYILTHTGKHFDFVKLDPDSVDINDIAWALSQICRYTGHTNEFYSVGMHSILASELVAEPFKLEALLHDAAEAYLSDISSPLKQLLPDYQALEKKVDQLIRTKFFLPLEMSPEVKLADRQMLSWEYRDLLPSDYQEWSTVVPIPYLYYILPVTEDPNTEATFVRFLELAHTYMKGSQRWYSV